MSRCPVIQKRFQRQRATSTVARIDFALPRSILQPATSFSSNLRIRFGHAVSRADSASWCELRLTTPDVRHFSTQEATYEERRHFLLCLLEGPLLVSLRWWPQTIAASTEWPVYSSPKPLLVQINGVLCTSRGSRRCPCSQATALDTISCVASTTSTSHVSNTDTIVHQALSALLPHWPVGTSIASNTASIFEHRLRWGLPQKKSIYARRPGRTR